MFSSFTAKAARGLVLDSIVAILALVLIAAQALPAYGQDQPTPGGQNQTPPPEAGGPQTDVGPYAIPNKKKDEPPPPPPTKPKKIEGMPDYSIKVDVPLVNLDVLVTTKDGQFIPGLHKENFRVYEDGAEGCVSSLVGIERRYPDQAMNTGSKIPASLVRPRSTT
jgi:hypothetical protein